MIDLEYQKQRFKDHVATFTDYGNIKILDFQEPGTCEYRIRFIFEEDHYRLHISGDLGELTAYNFTNMRYDEFSDFTDNPGYFEEKVQCHSRDLYVYDDDKAREELKKYCEEQEWVLDNESWCETREEAIEEKIDDILEDFDSRRGIGSKGYEILSEMVPDAWEYASDLGKERIGIIELYMLAFKLAQENLKKQEVQYERSTEEET